MKWTWLTVKTGHSFTFIYSTYCWQLYYY